MKVVFLDRDGTLIVDPPDRVVDKLEKLELMPDSVAALRLLADAQPPCRAFIVSNQIGISQGRMTEAGFLEINNTMLQRLAPSGLQIEKTYFCPHAIEDNCDCRKPKTGMVDRAVREFNLDLSNAFVIGDRDTDLQLGKAIGAKAVLVPNHRSTGHELADFVASNLTEAVRWVLAQ
jgi:histidinol-phosphate phosphatase family protein